MTACRRSSLGDHGIEKIALSLVLIVETPQRLEGLSAEPLNLEQHRPHTKQATETGC